MSLDTFLKENPSLCRNVSGDYEKLLDQGKTSSVFHCVRLGCPCHSKEIDLSQRPSDKIETKGPNYSSTFQRFLNICVPPLLREVVLSYYDTKCIEWRWCNTTRTKCGPQGIHDWDWKMLLTKQMNYMDLSTNMHIDLGSLSEEEHAQLWLCVFLSAMTGSWSCRPSIPCLMDYVLESCPKKYLQHRGADIISVEDFRVNVIPLLISRGAAPIDSLVVAGSALSNDKNRTRTVSTFLTNVFGIVFRFSRTRNNQISCFGPINMDPDQFDAECLAIMETGKKSTLTRAAMELRESVKLNNQIENMRQKNYSEIDDAKKLFELAHTSPDLVTFMKRLLGKTRGPLTLREMCLVHMISGNVNEFSVALGELLKFASQTYTINVLNSIKLVPSLKTMERVDLDLAKVHRTPQAAVVAEEFCRVLVCIMDNLEQGLAEHSGRNNFGRDSNLARVTTSIEVATNVVSLLRLRHQLSFGESSHVFKDEYGCIFADLLEQLQFTLLVRTDYSSDRKRALKELIEECKVWISGSRNCQSFLMKLNIFIDDLQSVVQFQPEDLYHLTDLERGKVHSYREIIIEQASDEPLSYLPDYVRNHLPQEYLRGLRPVVISTLDIEASSFSAETAKNAISKAQNHAIELVVADGGGQPFVKEALRNIASSGEAIEGTGVELTDIGVGTGPWHFVGVLVSIAMHDIGDFGLHQMLRNLQSMRKTEILMNNKDRRDSMRFLRGLFLGFCSGLLDMKEELNLPPNTTLNAICDHLTKENSALEEVFDFIFDFLPLIFSMQCAMRVGDWIALWALQKESLRYFCLHRNTNYIKIQTELSASIVGGGRPGGMMDYNSFHGAVLNQHTEDRFCFGADESNELFNKEAKEYIRSFRTLKNPDALELKSNNLDRHRYIRKFFLPPKKIRTLKNRNEEKPLALVKAAVAEEAKHLESVSLTAKREKLNSKDTDALLIKEISRVLAGADIKLKKETLPRPQSDLTQKFQDISEVLHEYRCTVNRLYEKIQNGEEFTLTDLESFVAPPHRDNMFTQSTPKGISLFANHKAEGLHWLRDFVEPDSEDNDSPSEDNDSPFREFASRREMLKNGFSFGSNELTVDFVVTLYQLNSDIDTLEGAASFIVNHLGLHALSERQLENIGLFLDQKSLYNTYKAVTQMNRDLLNAAPDIPAEVREAAIASIKSGDFSVSLPLPIVQLIRDREMKSMLLSAIAAAVVAHSQTKKVAKQIVIDGSDPSIIFSLLKVDYSEGIDPKLPIVIGNNSISFADYSNVFDEADQKIFFYIATSDQTSRAFLVVTVDCDLVFIGLLGVSQKAFDCPVHVALGGKYNRMVDVVALHDALHAKVISQFKLESFDVANFVAVQVLTGCDGSSMRISKKKAFDFYLANLEFIHTGGNPEKFEDLLDIDMEKDFSVKINRNVALRLLACLQTCIVGKDVFGDSFFESTWKVCGEDPIEFYKKVRATVNRYITRYEGRRMSTENQVLQHILRCELVLMIWMSSFGKEGKPPEDIRDCGWRVDGDGHVSEPLADSEEGEEMRRKLLENRSCKCGGLCANRSCGCFKGDVLCTTYCRKCGPGTCLNRPIELLNYSDEEENDEVESSSEGEESDEDDGEFLPPLYPAKRKRQLPGHLSTDFVIGSNQGQQNGNAKKKRQNKGQQNGNAKKKRQNKGQQNGNAKKPKKR